MAENMDHLGQQFGEYRLLRWLGGGGCGEVYLGEHVRDQTQAAVKVLHARLTDPGELKAFINEARTIRLKHPNIVPLLDFGIETNDIPFLVMEYAPHGTLRTLHPKGSRLPLSTIIEYVNPIASALQYAHNLHLVHRDVKPENMLIGANGQILLSDFGLATLALNTYSSQEQKSISGTIPYMAPEQFEGKPHPASDQYALAIVIYEWLSGVRPFQGTTNEIAMQHRLADPQPLREQVPYLSHEVEQVVLTALAKDPRQRFASVEAFAAALGAVGQTGRISVLSPASAVTKVLTTDKAATSTMPTADEEATSTMATDVVLESQPVDVAAPGKRVQSGSIPIAVAQTHPSAPLESAGVRSVLSKRKTTVAGLALILSVIALLLIYSFTSGAQLGVKHASVMTNFPTILSKPAILSTAVPPIEKTVAPQEQTVLQANQPTAQPTTRQLTAQSSATQAAVQSIATKPTAQPTTSNQTAPSTTAKPTAPPAAPTPTVPPATPTPLVGVGSVRIDSGGSGSGQFVGDEDFSNTTSGRPSSASNNASSVIDTSGVSNPAPQSVYQSYRVGDCLYTIPHLTPNASYTVRLHFAETYWTQAGQRTFNVTLNGQVVLSNFDIIAAAGAANKAVVEQFVVHADSAGTITIQFQTVKNNAQINAIEVLAA